MAEALKLQVETGAVTVQLEDEHGKALGECDFNPADSNILKRYGAVVEFFNTVEFQAEGLTEEEQIEQMNRMSDDIAGQFDYLLDGAVSESVFSVCGPLSVTASGDFFFETVLEGVGGIIERVTQKRLDKKLAKIRKATAKYAK